MNELVLKTTEMFGDVQTDIYENEYHEMFMTARQLGECLGYSNPTIAINKLVERNEFLKEKEYSTLTTVVSVEGKRTLNREMRVFNEDGIYEVTFLSDTDKALEFHRWVRRLLKALRRGDLTLTSNNVTFSPEIIDCIIQKHLGILDQRLLALETKTPTKPDYWRWKSSVATPMMKNLAQKLNCDVQDAFNVVYDNMTAKYGFNRSFAINQICCKYNTSVESVIDAIADCPEYQRWFFETANDMLQDNINTQFSPTISTPIIAKHIDLDRVQRVIQPLIEKYADTSPYGTVTYKRVYKVMHKTNRAWKAVMTRNRYKSRKDVLMNNNSYFKDFTQAVNTLLAESEVTTK